VNEVQVQELGLQVYTDDTGETIGYYAIAFSLEHEGQQYGLVKSLEPEVEPGDPHYVLAVESGKRALLEKVFPGTST
jgi:hypothetical protein